MKMKRMVKQLARQASKSVVGFAIITTMVSMSRANAQSTCGNGDRAYFSKYYVYNNAWNSSKAANGWWQCSYGTAPNSWGVDWNFPANNNYEMKSYPAIICGWQWGGQWSNNSGLSVSLSANKNIWTDWGFIPNGMSGAYNAAYDIWIHDTGSPSANQIPTAEIMIWLMSSNLTPGGTYQETVNLAGASWKVYKFYIQNPAGGSGAWNYFAFQRTSNTTDVTNMNLKAFTDYLRNKGWLNSGHYVTSVQAGWEVNNGTGSPDVYKYRCDVQW